MSVTCERCGEPFTPRPYGKRTKRYCSDKCQRAHYCQRMRSEGRHPETRTGKERREYLRAWGEAHADHRRAYMMAHPEWRGDNRKRARRFGTEYEPVDPALVFERDGWRCMICGKATPESLRGTTRPNAPELDHRVPMSMGGPHTYGNTQCACRACNLAKGNRSSAGQVPLWSAPIFGKRRARPQKPGVVHTRVG